MTGSARPGPDPQRRVGPSDDAAGTPDSSSRLDAVHQRLLAAVSDLTTGDGWKQMLRTAAALPTYSPHNVLLITAQRPQARAVAGFHTWKSLGRRVRKGEKGIAILAPVLRRHEPPPGGVAAPAAQPLSDAPSAPQMPGRPIGFRVVHVFDIGQTDGPDLPEPARPVLLDGQAPPGLIDGLISQVHTEGFALIRHDFDVPHPGQDSPNGVTDYFTRTVTVRPDLTPAQTAKTLAHELGHVLLHAPDNRPIGLSREQAEVEAESVAYVVTAAHGLDSGGYSIPYVAGWSAGNTELVARTAERVLSTAKDILAKAAPPPTLQLPADARRRLRERQPPPATERSPAADRPRAPGRTRLNPAHATPQPPGRQTADHAAAGRFPDPGRLW